MEALLADLTQFIINQSALLKESFFDSAHRTFWGFLLMYPFFGLIPFFLYKQPEKRTIKSFFKYCLPKEVYFHQSAKVDYLIFLVNRFVNPGKILITVIPTIWVGLFICAKLEEFFPPTWTRFESTTLTIFLFSAFLWVVNDLAQFILHTLFHRIPILWELHSVHHSAEVLMPLTTNRDHPIYTGVKVLFDNFMYSIGYGLLLYLTLRDPSHMTVLKFHLGFYIFNLLGANVRHSHLWISYGPTLSKIFISPAMHQVHHSAAHIHRNKNMGECLAIWDIIFGTLYIPKEKEDIEFGIDPGVKGYHPTLLSAYIDPLKNIYKIIFKGSQKAS